MAVLWRKLDGARSRRNGDRRVADPTREAFRPCGTASRGADPRRDVPDRDDAPVRAGADEDLPCRAHLDPRGALCAASPGTHPTADRRAAKSDYADARDAHHRAVGLRALIPGTARWGRIIQGSAGAARSPDRPAFRATLHQ